MVGYNYYNRLTPEQKKNFDANLIEPKKDYLKSNFESFTDFLSFAFTWDNTPQGYYYWNLILFKWEE